MKVFILLSLVAAAFAAQECPANSHHEECGSACPLTCDNHNDPPKACILMCVSGCVCDEGYVKADDGSCVRPDGCDAALMPTTNVCGENERFSSCGTACPKTCDNHKNPPKGCILMCVPGCHCEEGYVRRKDGRCVLPESCPTTPVCGANQEFKDCGTACPLTCKNHENPPKACVKMCVIGCHCKEGYVKTEEGECVKPENCPSNANAMDVCGANQKFLPCGTACPLSCDNYNDPPKGCVLMCVPGCHCTKGYVRGNEGHCVKPENCPGNAVQHMDRPDCDKKGETGPCRARMTRYYYDQEEGMCKTFTYGGCGGNRNNFETEFDCQNKCGALYAPNAACLQDKVVGPCKAAVPRHFFNKETGKCEAFIFGGCGGNSNNFGSKDDCESVCLV